MVWVVRGFFVGGGVWGWDGGYLGEFGGVGGEVGEEFGVYFFEKVWVFGVEVGDSGGLGVVGVECVGFVGGVGGGYDEVWVGGGDCFDGDEVGWGSWGSGVFVKGDCFFGFCGIFFGWWWWYVF